MIHFPGVSTAEETLPDIIFFFTAEENDTTEYYDFDGDPDYSKYDPSGLYNSGATITSSQAAIGTYAYDSTSTNDYLYFNITEHANLTDFVAAGWFYIYDGSWPNPNAGSGDGIFSVWHDEDNDGIEIKPDDDGDSNEFGFTTSSNIGYEFNETSSMDLSLNTWYVFQIVVDSSTPSREICIYNTNLTELECEENTGAFSFESPLEVILLGQRGTDYDDYYLDNIMISDDVTRDFITDTYGGTELIKLTAYPGGWTTTDYTADANCQGAWFMNSDTSETDQSGNSATLTEINTTNTSSTVQDNFSGNSRDFERSTNSGLYDADGGSTDISGADQNWSFCAWVKPEQDPGGDMIIVQKDVSGTDESVSVYLNHSSSSVAAAFSGDGTNTTVAYGNKDVAASTDWAHICVVYNDTDIRIYVDGSLDDNHSDNPKTYSSGLHDSDDDFTIGCSSTSGTTGFDGLIDEAILFDRELSYAEVIDIYGNGIDGSKGGND